MKKKAVVAMLIMCMAVSAAACGKSSDTEKPIQRTVKIQRKTAPIQTQKKQILPGKTDWFPSKMFPNM